MNMAEYRVELRAACRAEGIRGRSPELMALNFLIWNRGNAPAALVSMNLALSRAVACEWRRKIAWAIGDARSPAWKAYRRIESFIR